MQPCLFVFANLSIVSGQCEQTAEDMRGWSQQTHFSSSLATINRTTATRKHMETNQNKLVEDILRLRKGTSIEQMFFASNNDAAFWVKPSTAT